MGLPWFLEEHQITQHTLLPASKFLWWLGFPPFWAFMIYLALKTSLSACTQVLSLLSEKKKEWESRKRFPPADLTVLGLHTTLSWRPVLVIVSWMFTLVTNQLVLFNYFVHREFFVILFFSILIHRSKKCYMFLWIWLRWSYWILYSNLYFWSTDFVFLFSFPAHTLDRTIFVPLLTSFS